MELCDLNLHDYVYEKVSHDDLIDWETAKRSNSLLKVISGIMDQVLKGVMFIHDHDEVHRDLDPLNGSFFQFSNLF